MVRWLAGGGTCLTATSTGLRCSFGAGCSLRRVTWSLFSQWLSGGLTGEIQRPPGRGKIVRVPRAGGPKGVYFQASGFPSARR